MKYKIIIEQIDPLPEGINYGNVKEVYTQIVDQLNVLDVIMAVNRRSVMPTTKEIVEAMNIDEWMRDRQS